VTQALPFGIGWVALYSFVASPFVADWMGQWLAHTLGLGSFGNGVGFDLWTCFGLVWGNMHTILDKLRRLSKNDMHVTQNETGLKNFC
jgi:hypothetical protein